MPRPSRSWAAPTCKPRLRTRASKRSPARPPSSPRTSRAKSPSSPRSPRPPASRLNSCVAGAATVVLSSLALKGVLEKSRSAFEAALGPLELRFDATQAILERLAKGTRADLLILTAEALEDLRKDGAVTEVRALGSSGVGLAVRAGAAKPDIGSAEALVAALLAASSVAHSKVGASGLYFRSHHRALRHRRPAEKAH